MDSFLKDNNQSRDIVYRMLYSCSFKMLKFLGSTEIPFLWLHCALSIPGIPEISSSKTSMSRLKA
jgi:hypothetical protein